MGIEAMTTSPSWRQLETPPSLLSGLEWVSATATRNFVLRNPLVDWLDRYGKKKGFVRDTDLPGYAERLEFVPFIMKKGEQFEAAVALHLGSLAPMVTIAQGRDDVRDMVAAERTFQALCEGTPRVHQAVLRDAATRTYGAADFLVRSDVFADLFPGHVTASEAAVPAPDLGDHPWHYVVIDAKFTTLDLLVSGHVGSGGSNPAYKSQLYPESTEGRPWGQSLKKLEGAPLNLG